MNGHEKPVAGNPIERETAKGQLTAAEIQEAQTLVQTLLDRKWNQAQIARACGFTAANISTLMRHDSAIARERFDGLKRLVESGEKPGFILPEHREGGPQAPTGLATSVRVPEPYLEGDYVKRTKKMVDLLKDRGFKMDEIATAAGYRTAAGLRQSLARGRVNPDVYTRIQAFIESTEALKRALRMGQLSISVSNGSGDGAVPKSGVKDPDLARLPDAVAVAKVALHDLRHGRAALESGLATKKFKSLMVAGINRLNRSISELEGQLEELLV